MKTAIITGSFDPITKGHEDLILRASKMFDKVYLVIVFNTEKSGGAFSPDDRLTLAKAAIASLNLDNVEAVLHSGLTSDIAHELGAKFIVRGARNATDFDYEYNLSLIMKRFDPTLETVILPASPSLSMISSTYVREMIKYNHSICDAVPENCIPVIKKIKNLP